MNVRHINRIPKRMKASHGCTICDPRLKRNAAQRAARHRLLRDLKRQAS